MECETKKYIVTGGPGCGKTTTLDLISKLGYQVVPEAPRMILQEAPHLKGSCLQEAIMERQSQLESKLNDGIAFLDRSLVDCEAYAHYLGGDLEGTTYESRLKEAKYQKTVFCLEPLPRDLYKNDNERKESYDEAVKIYELLKSTYTTRGFNVIKVPFSTPKDRAAGMCLIATGCK
jgi:predicted ATPase